VGFEGQPWCNHIIRLVPTLKFLKTDPTI
jgi:hypothetical protein